MYIFVAALGFVINLIGVCCFSSNGHLHSHLVSTPHWGGHVNEESHDHRPVSSHSHSHSHAHSHSDEDLNLNAISLHFLGDCLSSLCVLVEGIVLNSRQPNSHPLLKYIDPIASLLIVIIILFTTIPLVTLFVSCLCLCLCCCPEPRMSLTYILLGFSCDGAPRLCC